MRMSCLGRAGTVKPRMLLIALVAMVIACNGSTPSDEVRQKIEAVTMAYLNDLARAYSENDLGVLKEHAAPREINEVRKLLEELQTTGDRLHSTLLHAEILKVTVFRRVNATVTLTEVWDVGRYDAYTGHEKGRNPHSIQSSIVQMRRIDGIWMVIGRRVMETQKGSAWGVATPIPTSTSEPVIEPVAEPVTEPVTDTAAGHETEEE